MRLLAGLGDAVGEKPKLGAGSAGHRGPVNPVGVAETCADQDLPPRMPGDKPKGAGAVKSGVKVWGLTAVALSCAVENNLEVVSGFAAM